jgi:hypothetical protein
MLGTTFKEAGTSSIISHNQFMMYYLFIRQEHLYNLPSENFRVATQLYMFCQDNKCSDQVNKNVMKLLQLLLTHITSFFNTDILKVQLKSDYITEVVKISLVQL